MASHLPTHNDQPTFEDKLGREKLVEQVARQIATGEPPLVFGIHGDWGSGKTSFLYQLANELCDDCHCGNKQERPARRLADIDNVFTVWFEAWRYQHEPAPVVALLHEICRQLPKHKKIASTLAKWGTMLAKGFFGAIDELGVEMDAAPFGLGAKAGIKIRNPIHGVHEAAEQWEKENYSGRLTTDRIRKLLNEAISKLLGVDEKTGKNSDRRICIIIDDLDRCEPTAALRLLEGIKIYLSLDYCVFVLGVNVRQVEQAIAPHLPGAEEKTSEAERHAEASEYLEKLCTFTWKLPFPSPAQQAELLKLWLANPAHAAGFHTSPLPHSLCNAIAAVAGEYDCLPSNPRKIKGLANTIRQLAARGWREGAQLRRTLDIPNSEADSLLVAASIDHFHTELLRYLQTYPGAWSELIYWVNGKSVLADFSDLARVFVNLQRSAAARVADDRLTTVSRELISPVYPDPVHLNVFRIHRLLREATATERNSVTRASISRYLDLASFRKGDLSGLVV